MKARDIILLLGESVEDSIDLGNGYQLMNLDGPKGGSTSWRWKAYDKDGNLGLTLYLSKTPDSEVWAITDVRAYHRGKGLGRLALKALIERGLHLRSSPTGDTSDEAERMWKSLGARSLRYDDQGYGNSWYALPNPPNPNA